MSKRGSTWASRRTLFTCKRCAPSAGTSVSFDRIDTRAWLLASWPDTAKR